MQRRVAWLGAVAACLALAQAPAPQEAPAGAGPMAPAPGAMGPGYGAAYGPGAFRPVAQAVGGAEDGDLQRQRQEDERLEGEIHDMKRRENGPSRFASDLFEVRNRGTAATDGGVSEDYVLGTGDRLNVTAFGSANFEAPLQVDGKGEIAVPRVGTVKVGGRTLGEAKHALTSAVGGKFSRTTVDVQVAKLREVRILLMGEVYKPGSYLVPSLSSLVNVLSLGGGPTAVGSYRDVRVIRGGRVIHTLDLYELRTEGTGNGNFNLQNGDTVFVPLAKNLVTLEGAFTRVAARPLDPRKDDLDDDVDLLRERRNRLSRDIKAIETRLAAEPNAALSPLRPPVPGQAGATTAPLSLTERAAMEDRLRSLKGQMAELGRAKMGDHRLKINPDTGAPYEPLEFKGMPEWQKRWEQSGEAPAMQFELKPGETVQDALRFAGGVLPEAGEGVLSLRRRNSSGVIEGVAAEPRTQLRGGDVLEALPRRERTEHVVVLTGWARVPGTYARTQGMHLRDLLKQDAQVLPDTYRPRGEVVRTAVDGTKKYFAFDVEKALAGDAAHNLALEDRDSVHLYRVQDFKKAQVVTVLGPVSRPGTYDYVAGMRASDLLFRAGVPSDGANQFVAELAHTKDGEPSEVVKLDLTKLLSTDARSPLGLNDDAANPRIQPFDQLSVFEKPDFRRHRTVRISGQVARPGAYALDAQSATLSHLLQRAGGLTPEAMPQAGVFLRRVGGDGELAHAAEASGLSANDPSAKGINEILERLNETKRQPSTGELLKSPLLHGLVSGSLNRMVVDFQSAMKGGKRELELQDGDEIIIPRKTDAAYVVGECASPFATYNVTGGVSVSDLLSMAGGTTRNADCGNIRLLKADGRIIDSWVMHKRVEAGDTVLVPQRIRRDTTWQESVSALTPLAIILSALRR